MDAHLIKICRTRLSPARYLVNLLPGAVPCHHTSEYIKAMLTYFLCIITVNRNKFNIGAAHQKLVF